MSPVITNSKIPKYADRMPEPTHPGEVLLEEWLRPLNMSQSALAEKMGVDVQVVNGIVRGRRAVTAAVALRLARTFDTSPQFWMNLQQACDLWEAQKSETLRNAGSRARR
jgi:addiction module HigA family antidote